MKLSGEVAWIPQANTKLSVHAMGQKELHF